jgi:hypothetical protein
VRLRRSILQSNVFRMPNITLQRRHAGLEEQRMPASYAFHSAERVIPGLRSGTRIR